MVRVNRKNCAPKKAALTSESVFEPLMISKISKKARPEKKNRKKTTKKGKESLCIEDLYAECPSKQVVNSNKQEPKENASLDELRAAEQLLTAQIGEAKTYGIRLQQSLIERLEDAMEQCKNNCLPDVGAGSIIAEVASGVEIQAAKIRKLIPDRERIRKLIEEKEDDQACLNALQAYEEAHKEYLMREEMIQRMVEIPETRQQNIEQERLINEIKQGFTAPLTDPEPTIEYNLEDIPYCLSSDMLLDNENACPPWTFNSCDETPFQPYTQAL